MLLLRRKTLNKQNENSLNGVILLRILRIVEYRQTIPTSTEIMKWREVMIVLALSHTSPGFYVSAAQVF